MSAPFCVVAKTTKSIRANKDTTAFVARAVSKRSSNDDSTNLDDDDVADDEIEKEALSRVTSGGGSFSYLLFGIIRFQSPGATVSECTAVKKACSI